ncbi:MAG: AAA family ATPase [Betaproteobacteria bacterium]|nr:MAG: AAA family ATPase [Betaproteobacteria bacterium]
MYLSHFGLREPPFGITPDTSFFYACASSQEALNTLLVAVANGEGFLKITGEVGTGKTLLCRKFLATLDDNWISAYVPNPNLEPKTLLLALAEEMRVKLDSGLDQHHLLKALTLALLDFARQKRRVVVCLDETQAMPLESLETLRLLTNLETEKRKLVQVILFGQPELDERLAHESIRQLRQRITFQHHLGTLTREETEYYLAHRLAIAGYSGEGVFAPGAVNRIYRASRGVPRLVNILANKAMMLAYGEGSRRVSAQHARAAAADTPASFALSRAWLWLALACVAFSSIGWMILR